MRNWISASAEREFCKIRARGGDSWHALALRSKNRSEPGFEAFRPIELEILVLERMV